jgi:serine protease Do
VAEAMGLAEAKGALVTDVPEGPAKDAGMPRAT